MPITQTKTVAVAAAADGVNVILAGIANTVLRITGYCLTVRTTAGLVTIQDTTGTPVVLGYLNLAIGEAANFNGDVHNFAFETSIGKGLDLSNAAGVDVYGHISYCEVT